MSFLVLLETLIFIKNCFCLCHAISCTVSNTTTGPDSKLSLTVIGILTLYALMDSSFWFETINLEGPLYTSRGHRLLFPNKSIFLSLKIFYFLANGIDPDEIMSHSVAFHQSFHSLLKYAFRSH